MSKQRKNMVLHVEVFAVQRPAVCECKL